MNTLENIKALCNASNISVKRLEAELGYGNGSIAKAKNISGERIYEISKYFNVSMEYLMNGISEWQPTLSDKELIDIGNEVQGTLNALDNNTGLMFDGEILDEETKEYLESALKTAYTNAKIMAKEKYTPNKYKK